MALVKSLRKKGISSEAVLNAIAKVPREEFIRPELSKQAYEDIALPIECEQTISQPYTVAFMTELLEIEPGMKVLEIGTGSGYQAAILYNMGADVVTIEIIPFLHYKSKQLFKKLGYEINTLLEDGSTGSKQDFLFDRILVTAAAPEVPNTLLSQLKIGGKMVVPIGDRNTQTMNIFEKLSETKYSRTERMTFKFVPLIGEEGWKEIDSR